MIILDESAASNALANALTEVLSKPGITGVQSGKVFVYVDELALNLCRELASRGIELAKKGGG